MTKPPSIPKPRYKGDEVTLEQRKAHFDKQPTPPVRQLDNKPRKKKAGTAYTLTYVSNQLNEQLKVLNDNQKLLTKTELFAHFPYSMQRFRHWLRKYDDSELIKEKYQKITEVLESRLINAGLGNHKNPTMVIFLLKNHYNYADKQEVIQDTSLTFKVSRGHKTTPQQINKRNIVDVVASVEK